MHPLLISNILLEVFRHLPFCETFRFHMLCKAWKEAFFKYLPDLLPETLLQVLYTSPPRYFAMFRQDQVDLSDMDRVEKVYKLRFLEQNNLWSVFILHPSEDQAGISVDEHWLRGFRVFSKYFPCSHDLYDDRGPFVKIKCDNLGDRLSDSIDLSDNNICISARVCKCKSSVSDSKSKTETSGDEEDMFDDDEQVNSENIVFRELVIRVHLSAWKFNRRSSQRCECILQKKRERLQKEILHNGWTKCSPSIWDDFVWNPRAKHQWGEVLLQAKWSHRHAVKKEWIESLLKRNSIQSCPPEDFLMLIRTLSYQKIIEGDEQQEKWCLGQLRSSEKIAKQRKVREKKLLSCLHALIKKRFPLSSNEEMEWELTLDCKELRENILTREQTDVWNNFLLNGGNANDVAHIILKSGHLPSFSV